MTIQTVSGTLVGSGAQVILAPGEGLLVTADAVLGSNTGTAIYAPQDGHDVNIQGTVSGYGSAARLGSNGNGTGQHLFIGSNAYLAGFGDYTIEVYGFASSVENRGTIWAGGMSGGLTIGATSGSTRSSLVNSGTIEAPDIAVERWGGEAFIFHNGGLVRGGTQSFTSAGYVSQESITNTGRMIGDVDLGAGNDVYEGASGALVGKIYAGEGNDTIRTGVAADWMDGGTGNDILRGNGGNDLISAGAGADQLFGGIGGDLLTGGVGNDRFHFDTALAPTNVDRIADFSHVNDAIFLDNAVFKALGAAGGLSGAWFWQGAKAHDANDHVIYNKASGALYYDSDGTGAHGQVQFAVLLSKPADLAANDFVVF